jgi:hypothetical protein
MISGILNRSVESQESDGTKERRRKARLSPVTRLHQDVAETLTIMASKLEGEKMEDEDEEGPDETEDCYESDDFQVLETQLVVDQADNNNVEQTVQVSSNKAGVEVLDDNNNNSSVPWSARTSFTADSPYFDAFCDSEIRSLRMLSDTLNGIAAKTKTFVKQGAMMSEASRRLAQACKLRSSDYYNSEDDLPRSDDGDVTEEELTQQRRSAVGEEMAGILELLGEVSRSR